MAKMFCFSYYCLYSVFNKIRDKGRTVSAWKREVREGEGDDGERRGEGEEMAQTLYAHMNKRKKKKVGK
jgi:hypothetical protein